ncbi:hypothetical protein AO498_11347 [Algoriphagus sanaruensis]|uniref:Uncharacterized protein n=1 Tax=Algoriphagus sanaruensis TaxID=1727163 RepID=A0A142EPH6_9BACT|nr:hypothetical protein AO498_11347 [Algoriphagus sanaruensis]
MDFQTLIHLVSGKMRIIRKAKMTLERPLIWNRVIGLSLSILDLGKLITELLVEWIP